MGFYRLLLALCVVSGHTWRPVNFEQGRSAVIGFFLISGYVMTLLIEKYYKSFYQILLFYWDRLIRIFPQYILYVLLTICLTLLAGVERDWTSQCSLDRTLANLVILPLYFGNVPWYLCTYLPQAWSLALEIMFYLVVPAIVILWSCWLIVLITALSLWVYLQAFFGFIDTDWNGFRHLPGTLYIFIVGMTFTKTELIWKLYRWGIWVGALTLSIILLLYPTIYALPGNKETLVGLLIGIPALAIIKDFKTSSLEQLAGNLSYGVFLNHFMVYLAIHYAKMIIGWRLFLLTAAISIPLSFFSFNAVESPLIKIRRSMRKKAVI